MYISNRNKKTHIHWQQLLMKNQTEKATLKEEIRALSHANEINEHRYADILNQRIKLWHQSLHICVRLFKTTASYRKIQTIETSKNKKDNQEISFKRDLKKIFINTLYDDNSNKAGGYEIGDYVESIKIKIESSKLICIIINLEKDKVTLEKEMKLFIKSNE